MSDFLVDNAGDIMTGEMEFSEILDKLAEKYSSAPPDEVEENKTSSEPEDVALPPAVASKISLLEK
jgi:hypothetical protein